MYFFIQHWEESAASAAAQVYFVLMTPWCFLFLFLALLGLPPVLFPRKARWKSVKSLNERQHGCAACHGWLGLKFQTRKVLTSFEGHFLALTFLLTILLLFFLCTIMTWPIRNSQPAAQGFSGLLEFRLPATLRLRLLWQRLTPEERHSSRIARDVPLFGWITIFNG